MNIGICDDERIMVEQIECIIKEYFDSKGIKYNIFLFYSGKEVTDTDINLDLLFLDIDMPEMNGMQAAEIIQESEKVNKPLISFLTSHEEEVRNAFKVKAFRFLVKDSFESEIYECLDAFCKEKSANIMIDVEKDGHEVKIFQKDILYIKTKHNGSEIWLRDDVFTSKRALDK